MSNFLKATNLNVRYGNVAALRGVDFHVDQGEIVTLIGPNGAGKTSTLMAISNLIDGKKTGFLVFEGQDISHMESSSIVKLGISHVPEGRRHLSPPDRGRKPDDGYLRDKKIRQGKGLPAFAGRIQDVPPAAGTPHAAGRHPVWRRTADCLPLAVD